MALFTTSQTGNWSSSSTWGGAGVPGNGDTVAINHTVTVDTNTIIGTSPSDQTTKVITAANDITLTIATGVMLTVRGNASFQRAGGVTLGAGATWKFDASQATTTTTSYKCDLNAGFISIGLLTANGTSGSHCTITSNSSGGNGMFVSSNGGAGTAGTGYCDVSLVGDNNNDAMSFGADAGSTIVMLHWTFAANCGAVAMTSNAPATAGWDIRDCQFNQTNAKWQSTGIRAGLILLTNANPTSVARKIYRCTFAETVAIGGFNGDVQDCIFMRGQISKGHTTKSLPITGCLFRFNQPNYTGSSAMSVNGDVTGGFAFFDGGTGNFETGTASSASGTTLTDSSKAWAPGCWVGYVLKITSGIGTGQWRVISANTATAITVPTWTTNPDNTSVYAISALIDSGTATTGGSSTLTDSGKSWGTNAFSTTVASAIVEITGGTGIRQRRLIASNTSSVLTVAYQWDVIPDATSTYTICEDLANNHGFQPQGGSSSDPFTFSGNVFESAGCDTQGDCILHADQAAVSITSNIVLPNAMGDSTGTLVTIGGNVVVPPNGAPGPFTIEHNTVFCGRQSMVSISEGGTNLAGTIASLQSNICWVEAARTYYAHGGTTGPFVINDTDNTNNVSANSISDSVTTADYNCRWNLANSSTGDSYCVRHTSTFGTHDVVGSPTFLDRTRTFWSWAVLRGSTATTIAGRIADGLGYIKADPTLTRTSLVPYLQGGFAPTSSALRTAAHDGTFIGAMPINNTFLVANFNNSPTSEVNADSYTPGPDEVGAAMTNVVGGAGTMVVTTAGRLRANANGMYTFSGTPTSNDYTITAVFKCLTNDNELQLVWRYSNTSNYYYLEYRVFYGWRLFKVTTAGGNAVVQNYSGDFSTEMSAGQVVTVTIKASGSSIAVSFSGDITATNALTADDTSHSTGSIGIANAFGGATSTGIQLDSITAVPLMGEAAPTTSNVTTSSVRVTGAGATNAIGTVDYQYQRAPDSSGSPGTFANVGSAQTGVANGTAPAFLDDTGLTNNTTYWYRLVATDSSSNVVTSSATSVTTLSTSPPGQVTGLTPTVTSSTSISLSWTQPSGLPTQNKIYKGTSSGTETLLATISATTSYIATGLTNGTTYYFKVSAVNANGEGSLSTEVNATAAPTRDETYTAAVLADSPVGYYRFGELSGTVATDSSGNSHNGTYSSSPAPTFGVSPALLNGADKAITFAFGSNQQFTATGLSGLDDGTVTYEMWLKSSNFNGLGIFFGPGFDIQDSNVADGKIVAVFTKTFNSTFIQTPNPVTDGAWHHIVAVVQSGPPNDSVTLYIDKVFIGTGTMATSNSGSLITGTNIRIGNGAGNVPGFSIDELAVYNGVLSSARVTAHFDAGNPVLAEVAPTFSLITTSTVRVTGAAASFAIGTVDYQYQRAPDSSGSPGTFANVGSPQTGVANGVAPSPLNDSGRSAGIKYWYRLVVTDSASNTSNGSSAQVIMVPAAPTGTSVSAGDTVATITWTGSTGASSYNLYRGTSSGSEIQVSTNVTSPSTDTGLTDGTTYYYKVSAVNTSGESALSNESSGTPTLAPPTSAPTSVSTVAGDTQATVTWSTVSNATGYKIYRSTTSGAEGSTPIATSSSPTYTDTGLTNLTTYYYKVAGYNAAGTGPQSAEVSVIPTNLPAIPINIFAQPITPDAVQLTWDRTSSNETSIIIRRQVGGSGSFDVIATLGAKENVYVDWSGQPAIAYAYTLETSNINGSSGQSGSVSATTFASQASLPTINAGSMSFSSTTSFQTTLTVADTTVTAITNATNASPIVITAANHGFKIGTSPFVAITGVGGNTAANGDRQVTIIDANTISVIGSTGNGAYTSGGLLGIYGAGGGPYIYIERSDNGGQYNLRANLSQFPLALGANLSYTDWPLMPNVAYKYRIRIADSSGGSGDYGTSATVTTSARGASVPLEPSNLSATSTTPTSVTVSWSDNSSGVATYKVERTGVPSFGVGLSLFYGWNPTWTQVGTTFAGVTNYTDSTVSSASAYFYRVRAHGSGGDSGYTTEVVVRTPRTSATSNVYSVGFGRTYSTIGALTWDSLNPGDTVLIYCNEDGSGNVIPYASRLMISRGGTAANRLNVIGVSRISFTSSPIGGTFNLSVNTPASGVTTSVNMAYNASTASIQSLLEALSNVGVGNVTVTGTAGSFYHIYLSPAIGQSSIVADGSALTGSGAQPTVVINKPVFNFSEASTPAQFNVGYVGYEAGSGIFIGTHSTGDPCGPDFLTLANVEVYGANLGNYFTGYQGGVSGTASSATSTTLTDTSKSLSAGIYNFGTFYVRIKTGTGAGQSRLITSYTSNTFTISPAWTTTPDATSTYDVAQQYGTFSAAIEIQKGAHVNLWNLTFHDCGLGIFYTDKGDHCIYCENIVCSGNYSYNNGYSTDQFEHVYYIEGIDCTIEYCDLGPTAGGGNQIKDRGAGTVIRYNRIQAPAVHFFDLVEAQSSGPRVLRLPSYNRGIIYGNIIELNGSASGIMHTPGDHGNTVGNRRGITHFHHNTVVQKSNTAAQCLLALYDPVGGTGLACSYDARNNIICIVPLSGSPPVFEINRQTSGGYLGPTWATGSVQLGDDPDHPYQGYTQGFGGLFNNGVANNPGFQNISSGDYRLTSSANVKGAASTLPSSFTQLYSINRQYAAQSQGIIRATTNDLGAYESPVTSGGETKSRKGSGHRSGTRSAS